jgi:hypothetical protein
VKLRADEHVSPKIVRAIREVSLSSGWELSCVREFHPARTADETWVPQFAVEGGQAIITADANMLNRPHQLLAIHQSNIRGIVLPSIWADSKRHLQAASLIYFWPQIEAKLKDAQSGEFWRLPRTLVNGLLEPIAVNYSIAAASTT